MAYINGNYTCFTPNLSITVEQVDGTLQTKRAPLLIEGETIIQPDEGFDALSEVIVDGVYYTERGLPYTRKLRLKTSPMAFGDELPNLEELIIDEFIAPGEKLNGFANCTNVREITFVNTNCHLEDYFVPFETAEKIKFESVSEDFNVVIWGDLAGTFDRVKIFEVFEGWIYDIVLVCACDLEAESIINIINNLAVVEYQTLWLGEANIGKVSPDIINIAVNKGWDVM